jgi:hypothetical protein
MTNKKIQMKIYFAKNSKTERTKDLKLIQN